jgi:hypothetical protein
MMQINGRITTVHGNAGCVASSLAPDNLVSMNTTAQGDRVTTVLTGIQLRSVIASVDDYLMNLAIAEDTCSSFSHQSADSQHISNGKTRSDTPAKNTVAGKKSTGRNSSR